MLGPVYSDCFFRFRPYRQGRRLLIAEVAPQAFTALKCEALSRDETVQFRVSH